MWPSISSNWAMLSWPYYLGCISQSKQRSTPDLLLLISVIPTIERLGAVSSASPKSAYTQFRVRDVKYLTSHRIIIAPH
jgi:hypothetical protein